MKCIIFILFIACTLSTVEIKMYGIDDNDKIIESTLVTITDKEIVSIKAETIGDMNVVKLTFDDSGTKKNKEFTVAHKGKRISIWINNQFLSSPLIVEPSEKSVVISSKMALSDLAKFDK